MKYIDKQIEAILLKKQRAFRDLQDCQKNLANSILSRLSHESKLPLCEYQCEKYMKEINQNFKFIESCNLVINELTILKQMNEGE